MNPVFRLPLNIREGSDLINYLTDSKVDCSKSGDLGILIAKGWANGKASIHVHGDLRIRGESDAHQLCWAFMRQGLPDGDPLIDWLDIAWNPSEYIFEQTLIGKRHAGQESSVLIDVRHKGQCSENVHPGLVAVGLAAIPRLRPLDDCPCVPIHGKTIQGTALFGFLRRRLDYFHELALRHDDREVVGLLRFVTFPKNQLPDEMVECCPQVIEEVTRDQGPVGREFRDWASRNDVPFTVTAEVYETGLGVLLAQSEQFVIERVEVYLCPPEFGSDSRDICDSPVHLIYSAYGAERDTENSQRPRDSRAYTGRVREELRQGGEAGKGITDSPPEEGLTRTSLFRRPGGCTAKHIHSGSLADA